MEGERSQTETLLLGHGKNSDTITLVFLQKDSLLTSVIVNSFRCSCECLVCRNMMGLNLMP